MNITMDGKYAYRSSPREQVRVLCVDKAGGYPVVVLPPDRGPITTHTACGQQVRGSTMSSDLVPLDESRAISPGIYRTRDGTRATICYIRLGAEYEGYLAVGWIEAGPGGTDTWKLDGQFSGNPAHRLDIIKRIGDLA